MTKLFISYREADSLAITGRIYADLRATFGAKNIFYDRQNIKSASNWSATLREQMAAAHIVIVVIGTKWLTVTSATGTPRLDDPTDWVRNEVETALDRQLEIIPVMVDGASPLNPTDPRIPPPINGLAKKQVQRVRNDPDFETDIQKLKVRLVELGMRRRMSPMMITLAFVIAAIMVIGLTAFFSSQAGSSPNISDTPTLTDINAVTATLRAVVSPSPNPTSTMITLNTEDLTFALSRDFSHLTLCLAGATTTTDLGEMTVHLLDTGGAGELYRLGGIDLSPAEVVHTATIGTCVCLVQQGRPDLSQSCNATSTLQTQSDWRNTKIQLSYDGQTCTIPATCTEDCRCTFIP